MQESIRDIFTESIQAQIASGEVLPEALEKAALSIAQGLINGNKLLCAGTQSCHMLSDHFANLLVNFFETERPCLPAVSLSHSQYNLAQTHRCTENEQLARQVRALAQPGDLLLVIAVDGQEKEIISAVEAALTKDMNVIALVGDEGGELTGLLSEHDVEIRVPSKVHSRIIESHLFTTHCLAQLIDAILFPQDSE